MAIASATTSTTADADKLNLYKVPLSPLLSPQSPRGDGTLTPDNGDCVQP